MAFDWGGLLGDLLSGVEIPIGSADDKSESNQDVTFQYGENLPYLENMLGYEMYGSDWNPPASSGGQPGGAVPPGAGGGAAPPPPEVKRASIEPDSRTRPSTTTVPFRWDLTPGAGEAPPPDANWQPPVRGREPPPAEVPEDGTVPLPNDQPLDPPPAPGGSYMVPRARRLIRFPAATRDY